MTAGHGRIDKVFVTIVNSREVDEKRIWLRFCNHLISHFPPSQKTLHAPHNSISLLQTPCFCVNKLSSYS